jgi:ADP-heptose:LPS heptosyltransferase
MIKAVLKKLYFSARRRLLGLLPALPAAVPPAGPKPRILVIRLDRVGDLALSTPVFSILRKTYPQADISALVKSGNAEILRNNPAVDNVFVYKGFWQSVKEHRGKYDAVIEMINAYVLAPALLTRLIAPAFSVGFDVELRGKFFTNPVIPVNDKKHFIEFLPDLLKPFGIIAAGPLSPEIFPGAERKEDVSAFLREKHADQGRLIAVHPGSFYDSQRWPAVSFAALIEKINQDYPAFGFVLLGSAGEKPLLLSIHGLLGGPAGAKTHIYAQNNIGNAIALISMADFFIGNNSGLLHIAAALKIPTVSFMGPTVPWRWYPWGPKDENIVFRKDLPCSPCNKGECRGHECMAQISPDEVFGSVKRFLDRDFEQDMKC